MAKGRDKAEFRQEQLMIVLWIIVMLLNFGGLVRTVGSEDTVMIKEGFVSALNLITLALLFRYYLASKEA